MFRFRCGFGFGRGGDGTGAGAGARLAAGAAVVLGLGLALAGSPGTGGIARASAQEPGAENPQPARPIDPTRGTYRSERLGIEYQLVPYEGRFGARLTRPPSSNSGFNRLRRAGTNETTYLEPGDTIVALDGQLIEGPEDVENHFAETTVDFINIRTGARERGSVTLPGGGGGGGGGTPESGVVRAFLLIDDASDLPGLDVCLENIRGLLAPLEAENRARVTLIRGRNVTGRDLLNRLAAEGNASNDTVFVYYAGHGATDPGRGHFLAISTGPPLLRSDLNAAIARLNPRLSILLTDCCSNVADLPPAVTMPQAEAPDRMVKSLFLRTRGRVDVTAATYDARAGVEESAWFNGRIGGLFTTAVADAILLSSFERVDANGDGLVTWREIQPVIRDNTRNNYSFLRERVLADPGSFPARIVEAVRGQPNQTPQAFSLDGGGGGGGGGEGGRRELGVMVDRNPWRVQEPNGALTFGMRILSVRPGSPAAAIGLEPGDIILSIDNRGFANYEEFLARLAEAPARASIRLRDTRTGRILTSTVSFPD